MNDKKLLFIQHGDSDKPGLLAEVACDRGITMDVLRPDLGDPVPDHLHGYAGLALGGGAQAVYEQDLYPYLSAEICLIRRAADAGCPVLGLCLGSQLMAAALGGDVRAAGRREIGFFEVVLEPATTLDPLLCGLPERFVAAHWHGDVFDLPAGGMRLASSALTPNQLFRYGHALYGLQFHLEMTVEILDEMLDGAEEKLRRDGIDPERVRRDGQACLPALRKTAELVLGRWVEMM